MLPIPAAEITTNERSNGKKARPVPELGKALLSTGKLDTEMKAGIERALWQDHVLRALDYDEIDVHVKNGVVTLNGHIGGSSNLGRVKLALRTIPGIMKFRNNLVLDDQLTREVASLLGDLEHAYNCKFFTGTTHGVVSIDGVVSSEEVRYLAERCAAGHPDVRGVINHIRVAGVGSTREILPFFQPAIGESIHFVDGAAGKVKQVIINPDTRRVIAMVVQARLAHSDGLRRSLADAATPVPEGLFTIPMNLVRYLTRVSGFLTIRSDESDQYQLFDPARHITPRPDWKAPYPYTSGEVLFPVIQKAAHTQEERLPASGLEEQAGWEQLLEIDASANDDPQ